MEKLPCSVNQKEEGDHAQWTRHRDQELSTVGSCMTITKGPLSGSLIWDDQVLGHVQHNTAPVAFMGFYYDSTVHDIRQKLL